jgi:hypothetical protein
MLTLEIDGYWEPEDFIEVLTAIESIYYKIALKSQRLLPSPDYYFFERPYADILEHRIDHLNAWTLNEARMRAYGHQRIQVARIQYASPGGIDLVGLGEACKAIDSIIARLITFFTERNMRKEKDKQATIETEIKQIELEKEKESLRALKIKNAREVIEILDVRPEFRDVLIPLLIRDQDKLAPRIAEGKIIGVKRTDKETK